MNAAFPTVDLRDNERACSSCGQAAVPGAIIPVEARAMQGKTRRAADGTRVADSPVVEMTRCRSCQARHDNCSELLAQHPALFAAMGDSGLAHQRLEATSDALAALGQSSALPSTPAGLRLFMRHLSVPGSAVAFRQLFMPRWTRGVGPTTATATPWAHLTDADRQALHRAYSEVLAERVAALAPPKQLPPPTGNACLMCGVGSVSMPAAEVAQRGGPLVAADEVWRSLNTTRGALGGRPQTQRLTGYACPACSAALDLAGAVGHTAMEHALKLHLRAAGRDEEAERLRGYELDGLAGWAAIGTSTPNTEPWGHITLGSMVMT